MSENGEIYSAGKNFTLPPAVTALTHSTSGEDFNTSKLPKQLEYWIEITWHINSKYQANQTQQKEHLRHM